MTYFRVYIDFQNFIPIDEAELEKALYAFRLGKPVIFNNGAASRIESIIPDWHAAMGWNYSYKLQPEDWGEIKSSGVEEKQRGMIAAAKENIELLLRQNRPDLIGKPDSEERIKLLK